MYKEWNFENNVYTEVYGRILYKRLINKIAFLNIKIDNFNRQIILDENSCENYECVKHLKLGDIVRVTGKYGYSNSGHASLLAESISLLTPCKYYPSDKHANVEDGNIVNKFRGIKMFTNPKFYETLVLRAQIFTKIREYFLSKNFLDLDMPILRPYYGGAEAEPFTTKQIDGSQLYLSIAPELDLKDIISGGISKLFTITHNFRNEGVDKSHHPEFAALEAYSVLEDYTNMINYCNEVITNVAKAIKKPRVNYKDTSIDFTTWTTITYAELIEKYIDATASNEELVLKYKDIFEDIPKTRAEINYRIFDKIISKYLIQPTNVIHLPAFTTPLCKYYNGESLQQCEIYIGGMELCNIYTEETSSQLLAERMLISSQNTGMPFNKLFIQKAEFGFPPMGGLGIGLDRLVMLLTENESILSTLPFIING